MPKAVRSKKSKPSVSVIGSGRLGTALAIAMSSADYRIEAVVTRHPASAKKAAALIGRATSALTANDLQLLPPSRIVLITTPDDEIAHAAQRLAGAQRNLVKARIVLHTSGALSSDVLAPLAAMGFQVGSLHPLVSVSDPQTGAMNLRRAFYCVEGDVGGARVARAIVRDLKGRSFSICSSNKPLYHAAAVMASGQVVALFDLATEMLVRCGLDPGKARRVLRPLLESTVNNLGRSDPATALTGTFARGDLATVQSHLSALGRHGLFVALDAYRALGIHALDLAKKNGADPQTLEEISKALESFSPPRKKNRSDL
ncbi:MAG: DUF2520 domain-containing protein [Acidobacteriota bacterium]|nr:DUF2520 domain-containing protein [Acidobacteriota bacterium]